MRRNELDYILKTMLEGPAIDSAAKKDISDLNEEMVAKGVRVFVGGLQTATRAKTIRARNNGGMMATDGPFVETREVLGGYWMIKVDSKEEAIAWAARCPMADNEIIEIRQVQEMSDFPPDVQKAAEGLCEMQQGQS